MAAAQQVAPELGVVTACRSLGVPRATFYRRQKPPTMSAHLSPRQSPSRKLTPPERLAVLDVLHSPEFVDKAPAQVYATLLDRGIYLCSIRTMYRILADHQEVKERRRQRRHPKHAKPQLVATGPNQVWSWDITKLRGPVKGVWYYLYVILDIYSRSVVGWMVAETELAILAERLIAGTCDKQGIVPGQLTIHADRGTSMKSKPVALLMADLGVAKSHSRPRVSDDNPFSESQFKTLKHHPDFPERFGSMADARAFCCRFFDWYNSEHRHSGLGLLTPQMVHEGRTRQILDARQRVLLDAYRVFPERFVRKPPAPLAPPAEVWINRPSDQLLGEVTH
jgi:putative transposase